MVKGPYVNERLTEKLRDVVAAAFALERRETTVAELDASVRGLRDWMADLFAKGETNDMSNDECTADLTNRIYCWRDEGNEEYRPDQKTPGERIEYILAQHALAVEAITKEEAEEASRRINEQRQITCAQFADLLRHSNLTGRQYQRVAQALADYSEPVG